MEITPHMIKRFYEAWTPNPVFDEWDGLWRKHFRIEVEDDIFIKLNNYRNRFRFQSLKASCRRLLPRHVYMSVLEWLLPERVSTKPKANNAYPVGGEYVVDIDHYLNYQPHSHRTTEDGVCIGCLEHARELTLKVLDAVNENHSQIKVIFSGKRGFHVHFHDFETSDWTRYDEKNPIKSHEVARFKYTSQLAKKVPKARAHFILSSDPMRVITVPESLNGSTGLVCAYLGEMFEEKTVTVDIGQTSTVSFTYTTDEEGTHTVEIEDLISNFEVIEVPPGRTIPWFPVIAIGLLVTVYLVYHLSRKR